MAVTFTRPKHTNALYDTRLFRKRKILGMVLPFTRLKVLCKKPAIRISKLCDYSLDWL